MRGARAISDRFVSGIVPSVSARRFGRRPSGRLRFGRLSCAPRFYRVTLPRPFRIGRFPVGAGFRFVRSFGPSGPLAVSGWVSARRLVVSGPGPGSGYVVGGPFLSASRSNGNATGARADCQPCLFLQVDGTIPGRPMLVSPA